MMEHKRTEREILWIFMQIIHVRIHSLVVVLILVSIYGPDKNQADSFSDDWILVSNSFGNYFIDLLVV